MIINILKKATIGLYIFFFVSCSINQNFFILKKISSIKEKEILDDINGIHFNISETYGLFELSEKYNNISLVSEIINLMKNFKIAVYSFKKEKNTYSWNTGVIRWKNKKNQIYFSSYQIKIKKNKENQILELYLNNLRTHDREITSLNVKKKYIKVFLNNIVINCSF